MSGRRLLAGWRAKARNGAGAQPPYNHDSLSYAQPPAQPEVPPLAGGVVRSGSTANLRVPAGPSAFVRGLGWRAGVALAVTVPAVLAVLAVEYLSPPRTVVTAVAEPIPAPRGSITLRLESTFPVSAWTIAGAGQVFTGNSSSTAWSGSVSPVAIHIQAEADDPLLSQGAVRATWTGPGGKPRTALAWGESLVTLTLPAEPPAGRMPSPSRESQRPR